LIYTENSRIVQGCLQLYDRFRHSLIKASECKMQISFNETSYESIPGLIILTNGDSQGILTEITKAVAVEYHWPEKEYFPVERRQVQVAADVLNQYAGKYKFPVGRNPSVSNVEVKEGSYTLMG
jgi:hypothetical protein